ncbi:MAG TPA: bifunctional methylenetetrahydrofolate dehydrogenase/methenyltetrahydrofolate cyclohydrolase FolD [Candidatus Norongarragalinales archaeon]|nr:bifunctional methylenetetrahydrofolate dehydrogenase/methenyltetrahydrofolate cyclohydrolase FolD [Candidatus Norongarragalinales archaeon]
MNMAARILDGKKIAEGIKEKIAGEIAGWKKKPGLATVLVGDNPASKVYVSMKNVACKKYGFYSREIHLPESISQKQLLEKVAELNKDNAIHGILVQLPLPPQIDENAILSAITPEKDVDGFHPVSLGKLIQGNPSFVPCTPRGVIHLIKSTGEKLEGKHAVVIGRSNIVGKPTAILLLQENCTVTVCHSRTTNLAEEVKKADIVVAAVGKPKLVTKEMVKQGAVVIDVGTTKLSDGRLCGDVDFDGVKEKASWITPVPGGVGPMTIAMLLQNTFEAAKKIEGL